MKISARSVLMAGITTLTASAVAIVAVGTTRSSTSTRSPQSSWRQRVQPLAQQPGLLQILLNDPARLLGPARPVGTITPPPAPIQFAIAPNLADTIDGIYFAVEPWVRWGFQVATDVVAWVPFVGWLAGQIMVFYNFGREHRPKRRLQLHRLAQGRRRCHREPGRFRHRRLRGIHLSRNRRVELLLAAAAAAAYSATAEATDSGPISPQPKHSWARRQAPGESPMPRAISSTPSTSR